MTAARPKGRLAAAALRLSTGCRWFAAAGDPVPRLVAEGVGTAFLVAAVIGSGIAASRLSPGDVGLQLLENSLVTGAVLVALIVALQPVSAALNPVVTLVERALGVLTSKEAALLIAAQLAGATVGAVDSAAMTEATSGPLALGGCTLILCLPFSVRQEM